jgi:hypothetical protein
MYDNTSSSNQDLHVFGETVIQLTILSKDFMLARHSLEEWRNREEKNSSCSKVGSGAGTISMYS